MSENMTQEKSRDLTSERNLSVQIRYEQSFVDNEPTDVRQIKSFVLRTVQQSSVSVNNRMFPSGLYLTSSTDETLLTTEYSKEFRKITDDNESYEGEVLFNNLHGHGFYQTQKNGQKVFYDGLFYLNKLEGYSQIFYEDGTYFQGLFKQHKRYGPGVLTYSNGQQDVGFWDGFTLVRLSSVVGSEIVPRLATTILGKTRILGYRYLVPLCDESDNIPKDIFNDMGAPDEIINHANVVLNLQIRNPNSLFFHKELFDYHFFGGKDCTIKVAVDDNESLTPSEEEEKSFPEEAFRIRIRNLKLKIKEMEESVEPFVAIKDGLQEKINYCAQCCDTNNSIDSIQTTTAAAAAVAKVTATAAAAERALRAVESSAANLLNQHKHSGAGHPLADIVTLDLGSLMPDGSSTYDASFTSFNVDQDFDIEQALQDMSTISSQQHIIQFCVCDEQDVDDLQNLEDQLSNIVKQETFYTNIRNSLQKKVNSMIEKEEKKREYKQSKFKLVEVTELWAWNNEELMMQMQKHCFKHRNSEEMVNFNVPKLILGNRKDFGEPGKYEDICHKFLTGCSKGNKDFVRRCLRENINPNLADARGNSGIFFAAAKDQIEIISILTNFGAKLDQINDDELTSLSLCILKYLSQKNKCDNWEKAFLPETEICTIPNPPKWYTIKSVISQSSSASSRRSESMDRQSSQNDFSNSRIVELFRRLSNLQQKTSSFIRNVPNTSYVFDLGYKTSESNNDPVEEQHHEDQSGLKVTHLTIMTLLDYGADPNIAKVPYPPLVLSLFSENPDLVTQLLQANANVNILVTQDNLSCLHILCSLGCSDNTIEICRLLLLFKCNPNLKALPTHWKDQKAYFRGNIPEEFHFEDYGKNALHLLCMRKDFESDHYDYFGAMCALLVTGGTDCNEAYLGHTALSLAVLAGNVRLVKYLIKHNIFDPYENLPYNMGNILTLFTLKRFENTLPTDKCKAMLTALFDVDVNILRKVEDFENAIAFAEEGDALFNLKSYDRDEKTSGLKGKPKPAAIPKKGDKFSQSLVMKEFLKDLGRDTIIKEIQMIATEILYDFTEENMLEETDIAIVLAEFLDLHIVIHNLEALFHSEKIHPQRLDHDYIKTLLNFVDLHKKIVKAKKPVKVTKPPKGKKGDNTSIETSAEDTIEHLIFTANFKKSAMVLPRLDHFVLKPGFDNPEIYKVCFHCLKGQNKELKLCPRCQLIRFCSAQCNKLNLKVKTQHICNLAFYDMTEEEIKEITRDVRLTQLASVAKENCRIRLHKKRETRLFKEEQKLLEMWRADKYGTKFLKFKPLLQKITKARKTTAFSVDLDGLKKLLERNFQKNPADFDSYSIDALMHRLSSRQKIQETRKSARSSLGYWLGSKLGSRVGSVFSEFVGHEQPKQESNICMCAEKIKHAKQKRKSGRAKKHAKQDEKSGHHNINAFPSSQFEELYDDFTVKKTRGPVIRKLKKIPFKYQKFIEIMGTYFPEVDMSYWLLPYACCSNGQLFYKFCDNEIFRESYSLS